MRMILLVLTLKLTSESKSHHLLKLFNIFPSTLFSLFLIILLNYSGICAIISFFKNLQWLPNAHWMKFKLHRLPFKIFHNLIPTLIPSLLVNWPLTVPETCHAWAHQCTVQVQFPSQWRSSPHFSMLDSLNKRLILLDPRSWVLNLKSIHSLASLNGFIRYAYLLKSLCMHTVGWTFGGLY